MSVWMFGYELVSIRTFWVMLIHVVTYRNKPGYVKLHCDMLGYAVRFWACVVLVYLDMFG